MKVKKKLGLKKMEIAQLSTVRGGNLELIYREIDTSGPSEQVVGGGGVCYSDSPTSCVHCV